MKLTGIDKSEAGREDQEAVDAMRAWKAQLGRLRTVLAAFRAGVTHVENHLTDGINNNKTSRAATDSRKLPTVPDIADVMPIRTARAAEGAVTSIQACALCGLKREERVAKVDVEVQDSFGEWWDEGAGMHVSCCRFWDACRDTLRSR